MVADATEIVLKMCTSYKMTYTKIFLKEKVLKKVSIEKEIKWKAAPE